MTETNMTAKEWLRRGWNLNLEINQLLESQKEAFLNATSTTCGSSGEKVQTSKKNTTEKKYIQYAEYSELVDKRIDELYTIKQEILGAVKMIDDSTLRTILIARYINFKTWDEIAAYMNYSRMQINRLHGKALLKMKDVIECYIGHVI